MFFKNLFKKTNNKESPSESDSEELYGPTDPYYRPLEWFLGEDGKKSLDFYYELYSDIRRQKQVERLVEDDNFHPIYHMALLERQKSYYSFALFFFDALRKNEIFIYSDKVKYTFLDSLSEMLFKAYERGKDVDELLSPEKNPLIRFYRKFNYPKRTGKAADRLYDSEEEDRKTVFYYSAVGYLCEAFKAGLDLSDEAWLYDESVFHDKKNVFFYNHNDLAYAISVKAEHPEYLIDGLDRMGSKSIIKGTIEDELF